MKMFRHCEAEHKALPKQSLIIDCFVATLLAMTVLLFFPTASHAFLADSFDTPRTENIVKRGDFVGGAKPNARVPFVKSQLVKDGERGSVLEISFNVSEGFGGTYIIFREGKIPENFNTVRFWIRGTQSAFKVELKDNLIHSFVVPKADRSVWREVTIPLKAFSNYRDLNRKHIKEFVFVFEDHRSAPRLGTIYIDDLSFVEEKLPEKGEKNLPKPGPVLVNGIIPSGDSFSTEKIDHLKLSSRLITRGEFEQFRFEASADRVHWFYLAEFPASEKKEFEYTWRISHFPSGTYWFRAVTVDQLGNREKGPKGKIKVHNYFNFNQFLDEIERKTFDYFTEEVDPKTFLVKDRTKDHSVISTGLSGFQWTAYVIGVERGWMLREEALKRMNVSLDFILNHLDRYHGLLPHWLDSNQKEVWETKMGDVVETSYVLAGALTAQAYFNEDSTLAVNFRKKVDQLIQDVEWDELLKRKKPSDEKGLLPWHWSEKEGASRLEVRGYNEAMIAYILALGTLHHPIPSESWRAWANTYQRGRYDFYELIACAPLFTHQYSHLWIDFRGKRDAYANYFENSIAATLANREYSLKENNYSPEIWGLTASESPAGYQAYGAPPFASSVLVFTDGTIAPTAAAGSMMFTPAISLAALKDMKDQYGEKIWGKYGFKDAFNPKKNWFSNEYLGLDQGPILIAIENYRTGLIWRIFMQNPYVQEGLKKAGFRSTKK